MTLKQGLWSIYHVKILAGYDKGPPNFVVHLILKVAAAQEATLAKGSQGQGLLEPPCCADLNVVERAVVFQAPHKQEVYASSDSAQQAL